VSVWLDQAKPHQGIEYSGASSPIQRLNHEPRRQHIWQQPSVVAFMAFAQGVEDPIRPDGELDTSPGLLN
jgi:hypothetical protein